jgi:hydrogenase assembly chaperone HypC/HupF
MCIGIPMQVQSVTGNGALCQRRGGAGPVETIDIRLLDGVQPGDWLLTFLGAARSVLTAAEAAQVDDALAALSLALDGGSVDHLFADLIDREPQLPPHLRAVCPCQG